MNTQRYDLMVFITIAIALMATVLNSYHLTLGFDLYHNFIVATILAIGLTGCFLFRTTELRIPYSVLTWVLLLILVIVQPLINSIYYPDYLVFPIGALTLTIILSIAIANIEDKKMFLDRYLYVFVGVMLISVMILFLQLSGRRFVLSDFIIFSAPSSSRLDANFTQPNQAAFMLALGELACLYFYTFHKNKTWLLYAALLVIGIALTSSRGGLILGVAAIVLFNVFYNQSLIQKFKNGALQLVGFGTIYGIGTLMLKQSRVSSGQTANAIERFSEGSLGARASLQEQAYLMFLDHPLTGYGWGNFSRGGIDYASEVSSFFFSRHSHVFLTHIASELGIIGILCLVPITVFIVKKINFRMDAYHAVCFTATAIIILYSCSEFPLWYLRYLIIFAIFITLIDSKFLQVKNSYSKLLAVLTLGSSLVIVIFIASYLKMHSTVKLLITQEVTSSEIQQLYTSLPDIFGLSVIKEVILFYYIPIDDDAIEDKLSIAERTTATSVTQRGLFKYGRLLALNNEQEKSITMFKAACAIHWKGECDNVIDELNKVAEKEPQIYNEIKYEIEDWVVTFDPRKSS